MSPLRRRSLLWSAGGMTLLEVLIAITILSVIVVLLVTSLRVGIRAWEAGERRAASHQELRAMVELLTEALSTAVPYRGRLGDGLERFVLFEGETDEVHWVTTAAPLILDAPVAPFHAVTLRHAGEEQLRLVERLVPNDEPFGDKPDVVLSRAVTRLRVEYRDQEGLWQSRWDKSKNALPVAVRIELTIRETGRGSRVTTFLVPIPRGSRS